GPIGPRGPAGPSSLTQVSIGPVVVSPLAGARISVPATCPGGSVATGGGFSLAGPTSPNVVVVYNGPGLGTQNSWRVDVVNTTGVSGIGLQVIAQCTVP
ncbi:MAG TPA: hypothetical protein VM409_06355, partial [Chloroflexia bacterium]|nr:hypothetical protein [Chloroflexia bacterium]